MSKNSKGQHKEEYKVYTQEEIDSCPIKKPIFDKWFEALCDSEETDLDNIDYLIKFSEYYHALHKSNMDEFNYDENTIDNVSTIVAAAQEKERKKRKSSNPADETQGK